MGTMELKRRSRLRSIIAAGAAGAAFSYLFDPDRGRGRRARLRDQVGATFRRAGRRGGRAARRAGSEAYGALQRATHPVPRDPLMDDASMKQKVETELFGRPDVSKGKIVVNVEEGMVVLRGEVDHEPQMKELAEATLAIPGVAGVQNLLHLPGEPAPNKRASASAATGDGG